MLRPARRSSVGSTPMQTMIRTLVGNDVATRYGFAAGAIRRCTVLVTRSRSSSTDLRVPCLREHGITLDSLRAGLRAGTGSQPMTIPVPVAKAITQALSCSHPNPARPRPAQGTTAPPGAAVPGTGRGPIRRRHPSACAQHPLRVLIPEAGRTVQASLRSTRSIGLPTSRGCTSSPPLCRPSPSSRPAVLRSRLRSSERSVPLHGGVRSCWWTVSMTWVACRAWGR